MTNPQFAIPKKTYFPVRNQNQLNHRREQLAKYLQHLAMQSYLVNSNPMIKFLELDKQCPEVLINQP